MICRVLILTSIIFVYSFSLLAAEKTLSFSNKEQETRYYSLLENLRCMKCANQSLADSQAGLAQDLRDKVYDQVNSGKSEDEVIDYLVARYGDYVLYKPKFKASTYLLWLTPFIIFILAFFILRRVISRHQMQAQGLSESEKQQLDQLLNNKVENTKGLGE